MLNACLRRRLVESKSLEEYEKRNQRGKISKKYRNDFLRQGMQPDQISRRLDPEYLVQNTINIFGNSSYLVDDSHQYECHNDHK